MKIFYVNFQVHPTFLHGHLFNFNKSRAALCSVEYFALSCLVLMNVVICVNLVNSFMELKAPTHKTSNNVKNNLIKEVIFENNNFQMLHVSFYASLLCHFFPKGLHFFKLGKTFSICFILLKMPNAFTRKISEQYLNYKEPDISKEVVLVQKHSRSLNCI